MSVNIDGMFLVAQAVGKQMQIQKSAAASSRPHPSTACFLPISASTKARSISAVKSAIRQCIPLPRLPSSGLPAISPLTGLTPGFASMLSFLPALKAGRMKRSKPNTQPVFRSPEWPRPTRWLVR